MTNFLSTRFIRLFLICWLLLGIAALPKAGFVSAKTATPNDTKQTSATLVVNNPADTDDGNCTTADCTLREAINAANGDGTDTTITFSLTDTLKIMPTSPLPTITQPVMIDGSDQAGATCSVPVVELNGSMAGANANGLNITAGNSTVKGLIITQWEGNGIRLAQGGSNKVQCSWIGVRGAGNTAAGNGLAGIYIQGSASNTIGGVGLGNIISANKFQGIKIDTAGATNNRIEDNIIGLGANTTERVGNTDGIYIFNVSNNTVISNTISVNLNSGIVIGGASASGNSVKGNFIGTNAANKTLGNYSNGIVIDGAINTIVGGSTAADANIIVDNGNYGITIFNTPSTGTQIKGNFIGVARNGTTSIPNFFHGIRATAGTGTIGGTAAGEGNVIAFNKANGVFIGGTNAVTTTHYTIVGNSMYSNLTIGIDLAPTTAFGDSVTANDTAGPGNHDQDTGPNDLQNFPDLLSASANASQTVVVADFKSTANSTFQFDFYSVNDCDSSGNGEGRTYLGRKPVTTGSTGEILNASYTLPVGVPQGRKITATATNAAGSTSEFSKCVPVGNLASVSVGDATIAEGNSGTQTMNFTVSLSAPVSQTVVISYTTSDVSAFAGLDYVAKTGTVSIPAGQTSVQIPITINGDTVYEPGGETFTVNLLQIMSNNATIEDGEGTGTIIDDDTAPTMSISDSSVVEGDSGTVTMVFTVTLSNASNKPITATYTTVNGTATAPSDYIAKSGTVTFIHDTLTQTIEIEVVGDVVDEANETFNLNLTGGTAGITISDNQAQGTIIDDDLPTLSIGDVTITEGKTGTKTMTFTVTRSSTFDNQVVTVQYATSDGTATAGQDYIATSGTLTFGATETSKTISVTINGDTVSESTETFFVTLSNPTNATFANNATTIVATGRILDAGLFTIYLPLILKNN